MTAIGERLQYLRKMRDWSLNDLAQLAGVSKGYLWNIECGNNSPTLEMLEKLAGCFKMSIPVFLGGYDENLTYSEHAMIEAYRAGDLQTMMRLALERVDAMQG